MGNLVKDDCGNEAQNGADDIRKRNHRINYPSAAGGLTAQQAVRDMRRPYAENMLEQTGEPQLTRGFEGPDGNGVAQVEASKAVAHRNAHARRFVACDNIFVKPPALSPEDKIRTRIIRCVGI